MSNLDQLAETHASRRHPDDLARLASHEVGLRPFVVALQHPDDLRQVAVRELELERHALPDVGGSHQVRGLHARRIPNTQVGASAGRERQARLGGEAEQ